MNEPPASAEASFLRDGVPDWDAIDFDVTCVRCGYNLKMLEQPRCPECGLEFDWQKVVNYHLQTSEILFEHQWRRRPIRSFFGTFFRTFLPARFWAQVSIYDRVVVGPLVFMMLLAIPLFLLVLHGSAWGLSWIVSGENPIDWWVGNTPFPSTPKGQLAWTLREIGRAPATVPIGDYIAVPTAAAGAVIGALLLILLLGETLGRCRVRRVQVLRVVAYAVLPTAVLQPQILLIYYIMGEVISRFVNSNPSAPPPEVWFVFVVILASVLILVSALGVYVSLGLKYYLRIPRPWLVGMTAAFIGLLSVVTGFLAVRLR